MVQTLAALGEELGLNLSTHIAASNLLNSSPSGADALFWPPGALHAYGADKIPIHIK